ncbi:thiamine phosphate synthase [Fulvimarina sp. 2208YS6-2-32]|uniref:Thiamine phosphate synthase n=1 Tax=Fulvimarina uroteuthidis TaxID=3098149 RepID=A0ABU5HZJ5_9HYPH|nr:thiamine phosphate synthase [Fulvimarina sp. 2208YS6-2-32]MDY8108009.1 thiamine phosphate synthase [Fulvimarina sp. 2208YS6-2-32]
MTSDDPIRQRLVLLTSCLADDTAATALGRALSGGDVASVLIDPAGREHAAFQDYAEPLVRLAQEAGAAALVVDDTQCAGRVRADGVHLTAGKIDALREAIEAHAPRMIIGASGFKTRHEALVAGEALPDYLFFGRLGQDNVPEPHPKTLAMAEWWADMVELPCIALGSNAIEAVEIVAETGAEFIALSSAIFDEPGREADRVAEVNAILEDRFQREKEKARMRETA